MVKLGSIAFDAEKALGGIWEEFTIPDCEGPQIECLIAQMGNSAYAEEIQRLTRPLLKGVRADNAADVVTDDIQYRAISKTILLDWKNVEDDSGSPQPYTPELGYETLKDPEYRPFYMWVLSISGSSAKYRKDVMDESVKNLESTSKGA